MPNALEISGGLHVTLLVFLRVLAISTPLQYKEVDKKILQKLISIIWILSVGVQLLAVFTQIFTPETVYLCYRNIRLHVFYTVPIVSIVAMNLILIRILKRKRGEDNKNSSDNKKNYVNLMKKKMTIMVQRVVVFHLVCNVPNLVWRQYSNIIWANGLPFEISHYEVVISYQLEKIHEIWQMLFPCS